MMTGASRAYINRMELGQANVTLAKLSDLSRALDTEPAALLAGSNSPIP